MNKIERNFFWQARKFLFQNSPLADYKVKAGLIQEFLLEKKISSGDVMGAVLSLITFCRQHNFLPDDFEVRFDLRSSSEPIQDTIEVLARIAAGMIDKEYSGLSDISTLRIYVLIERMIVFLRDVIEAGELTTVINEKHKDLIMKPRCALRKMVELKIIG